MSRRPDAAPQPPLDERAGNARPARSRRRLIAATVATLFAFASALTGTAAAHAAELDAITSMTIAPPSETNPDAPLVVGQSFRIDATWTVSAAAVAGDTFTLEFPSIVDGIKATMSLFDGAGGEVGTCEVGPDAMVCTLGEYANTHSDVSGTLFLHAKTISTTDASELTFATGNGTTLHAPLPGGELLSYWPTPYPDWMFKTGSTDNEYINWTVAIPSKFLDAQGGAPIVITDTPAAGGATLDASSFVVRYVDKVNWNDGDYGQHRVTMKKGTGPGEYGLSIDFATNKFRLWFNDPVTDGSRVYLLSYRSIVPEGAQPGDVFTNTVQADGQKAVTTDVSLVDSGGNANGNPRRTLQLTKVTEGDGTIPTDPFGFTVLCERDGAPVSGYPADIELKSGETASLAGIPVGSTCTIEETESHGADSVVYEPASTVTLGASSPSTSVVTATNTFLNHVGAVDVSLDVTGDASSILDPETEYTVEYSYPSASNTGTGTADDAGTGTGTDTGTDTDTAADMVTGQLVLRDGGTAAIEGVPAGTEILLTVIDPTAVAGGSYGDATYSGNVASTEGAEATVIAGDRVRSAVHVEIPFTADATVPAKPETPADPAPNSVPGLANTGVSLDSVLIVSAALLVLVGGGLLVARRLARRNADAKQ
ncbi:DUF5979 domain-containing protein [Streptomyces scabiei]|uniref:DUF5979 domain-containing protein n=1 Tax=Streptomyces scabiei TaxID=1930 RepID=UPI00298F6136|nr:DUF5979 domain-containing protein [Streptomyces scabiei]MDW8807937.1 DUF5979 domain-containing protein [Streptomyces scabiei]